MALPSKTQAQYVQDMVSTWATLLGFQPTLQPGDAFLALMETVASQFVFLQALAQAVNMIARAQTSTGADLDTFYAQFGFVRLPASKAEGPVTFTKLSPATSQVLIPPGVVVQTVGGAVQYQTIADPNQPTWNATLNAYVLQVGQTSLTASVQAMVAGSAYNVSANQLSQIGSTLPGIDQVNNPAPITDGADAEGDAAFRNRFVLFLNSLSKATYGAIASAIQGVQQGIEYNLIENQNLAGQSQPGEFIAVIDNGTGSPPASLVQAVQAVLEVTRGFTIEAQSVAVRVVNVTIALAVRVDGTFVSSVVTSNVANAIAAAVQAVGIGQTLYISAVEQAALSVQGVIAVQPDHTLIDGFAADFEVTALQAVRTDVDHVSVGTY